MGGGGRTPRSFLGLKTSGRLVLFPRPPAPKPHLPLPTHPDMLARSPPHSLRHALAGIDALGRMVRIDPKHAADHQLAVVDCLRSHDVALKRKTLELLYKMAGPANVEVVAREVLQVGLAVGRGRGWGGRRRRRRKKFFLAAVGKRGGATQDQECGKERGN